MAVANRAYRDPFGHVRDTTPIRSHQARHDPTAPAPTNHTVPISIGPHVAGAVGSAVSVMRQLGALPKELDDPPTRAVFRPVPPPDQPGAPAPSTASVSLPFDEDPYPGLFDDIGAASRTMRWYVDLGESLPGRN
jgi:hypothetical protein